MTRPTQFQFIKMSAWQFWLLTATGVAVGVAIAVVAAGLFLVLAPVALVAGLVYRLRGKKAPGPKRGDDIIEAEYTVIDPDDPRKGSGETAKLKRS